MKDSKFFDSASKYDPNNKVAHSGLISIIVGGSSRYVAMLDESPDKNREIDFNEWWNNTVFVDSSKRSLSRRDLILIAANQDGGTHVDPKIDEVYANISKAGGLGWRAKNKKEDIFIECPERAAIRQIAHEVLKTLIPGYSKKQSKINGMIFSGFKVMEVTPDEKKNIPQMKHKKKIGRNDPCFCGSGIKYKKCHGR